MCGNTHCYLLQKQFKHWLHKILGRFTFLLLDDFDEEDVPELVARSEAPAEQRRSMQLEGLQSNNKIRAIIIML